MVELTIRLVVSLAIVVGLLLLIARFAGRRFRGSSDALVQVVHRQPLSRSTAVAVVSVGSRVLVLGTTESHVSVLTELDPEELESGELVLPQVAAVPAQAHETSSFAAELDAARLATEVAAAPVVARPPARVTPKTSAEPRLATGSSARPAARPAARTAVVPPPVEVPLTAETAAALTVLASEEATPAPTPAPAVDLAPALALLEAENSDVLRAVTNIRTRQALVPGAGTGPLAGSVLSPQTWKQAFAVATQRKKAS